MSGCEFSRCMFEETLPAWEWRRLLELAHRQDINRGGFCDARLGAINFWCSPQDQPADPAWSRVEIRKGALAHPRAYVGAVYAEFIEAAGEADLEERTLQGAFGWGGLTTGDLAQPARVGGIVRLHWVMAPSEKAEAITGRSMWCGPVEHQGRLVTVEDFGTQADLDWCRAKLQALRRALGRHQG